MASPAYVWITDEQGNEIKSNCQVRGREGAIEALAFDYSVEMPTDKYTGTTTGTRKHNIARLVKAYDPSSPMLFDAVCHGKTLQKVIVKWYRVDTDGKERAYFTHTLEHVKVVLYKQKMRHVKEAANEKHVHEDDVAFRFGKITMQYHDGNILATDEWNDRN